MRFPSYFFQEQNRSHHPSKDTEDNLFLLAANPINSVRIILLLLTSYNSETIQIVCIGEILATFLYWAEGDQNSPIRTEKAISIKFYKTVMHPYKMINNASIFGKRSPKFHQNHPLDIKVKCVYSPENSFLVLNVLWKQFDEINYRAPPSFIKITVRIAKFDRSSWISLRPYWEV